MSRLNPATNADRERLDEAEALLRRARDLVRAVECPRTLARIRAAITSIDGAKRHVDTRIYRTTNPRN